MSQAHRDDLLVTLNMQEARLYPQFASRQVVTPELMHRSDGRVLRNVYRTHRARLHPRWGEAADLLDARGATILPIEQWEPEPESLVELIAALPAKQNSKSRDFGRGYAKAIKDVLELFPVDGV